MLSATLHEAAIDFGLALRQAPVLATFRAAAEALDADPFAQGLMADLNDQQTALARLQQAGLTPSRGQIDALRLCQAAIRANDTIMAYLRAANEVKAYLPTVASEISQALGSDYASLIAPTSC